MSSSIYYFADFHQQRQSNINLKNVNKILNINYPHFTLTTNVRSTASIVKYLIESFDNIPTYDLSSIIGAQPESVHIDSINTFNKYLDNLLRTLIYKESVDPSDITIISDNHFIRDIIYQILQQISIEEVIITLETNQSIGLENDIIIYIKTSKDLEKNSYIAFYSSKKYCFMSLMLMLSKFNKYK